MSGVVSGVGERVDEGWFKGKKKIRERKGEVDKVGGGMRKENRI